MPWRGHDALYCKVCGRHRDGVGPLSARYKCADCGNRRERENLDQLRAQQGPHFEAWRRGMYAATVEWLVEIGHVPAKQKQLLLDEFNKRSMVLMRQGSSRGLKKAGKGLPAIATERQRLVSTELREHYRKADGNLAQGVFLVVMNMDMQRGTPRVEAVKRVARAIRKEHPGFSPLRA